MGIVRKRSKEGGFTLIELMIALLVLTLVIVGYVGANITAQRNSEEMHERTLAIQDANSAIEQMRDASKTGTFPGNVVTLYPQNSQITGFNNLTNEQVTVNYANSTANPLDVTVTVAWLSYTQRQNTEAVQTYITQR